MKVYQLLEGVEVLSSTCDMDQEVAALCHDSRQAGPGACFVAIRGFQTDGYRFIGAAREAGASVFVTEEEPDCAVPFVRVRDSRRALAQMAAAFYGHPERALKLVGVTGTNGKTTSAMLIKHLLEAVTGAKVGLIGTNKNMVGETELPAQRTTPESTEIFSLLGQMRDAGCAYAVMEVSSHALTLDRVYGLRFEAAAFTNLTRDHLDFHGDMEAYFQAKALLFERCAHAVINIDDEYGQRLSRQVSCDKLTLSADSDDGGLVAKNIRLLPDRVEFAAVTMQELARVSLGIPGKFSVYNALTAMGCCLAMGLPLEAVAQAMQMAQGVKGRAEICKTPAPYTVLIDYAHTPDGMENILRAARGFAKGRVVALFGCGGDRDRTKRPLMGKTAAQFSDYCIVTSDNPRSEDPEAIIADILPGFAGLKTPKTVIADRREAIAYALAHGKPGDVIVLMGKGHETYQEICGQKHHLDEREEIAAFFEKNKG